LVRWLFLPSSGLAVGFGLPFVAGLLFAVPPPVSAVAGLVGGICAALLWGYAERRPGVLLMSEWSRQHKFTPLAWWLAGIGAVFVVVTIVALDQGPSWVR